MYFCKVHPESYDKVGFELDEEDFLMAALTRKCGYTLEDVICKGVPLFHNEKGAKNFIKSLFGDQHDLSLRFDVNQEVAEWKALPDFANTSSVQRPDVAVYMTVKIPNVIPNEVPCVVLVVEVHSGHSQSSMLTQQGRLFWAWGCSFVICEVFQTWPQ